MANSKNTSVLYTSLNRLLAYMKGNTVGVIDKELFIDIRKTFKKEYKSACLFYNASIVSELIKYPTEVLNSNYFKELEKGDNITSQVFKEQYKSLLRTVNKCYDNINAETMVRVVKTIGEEEVSAQKTQLHLLIKSLIMIQIFTNMKDTIKSTIDNHGNYNTITEYKNDFNNVILEQINECDSIIKNIINSNNLYFFNESDESDSNSFNTNVQNEFYETGLMGSTDYTESENNDYNGTIMHGNTKLDEFIFQLLYKSVMTLKSVIDDMFDHSDIIMMPNVSYTMFWLIVLLMHVIANY